MGSYLLSMDPIELHKRSDTDSGMDHSKGDENWQIIQDAINSLTINVTGLGTAAPVEVNNIVASQFKADPSTDKKVLTSRGLDEPPFWDSLPDPPEYKIAIAAGMLNLGTHASMKVIGTTPSGQLKLNGGVSLFSNLDDVEFIVSGTDKPGELKFYDTRYTIGEVSVSGNGASILLSIFRDGEKVICDSGVLQDCYLNQKLQDLGGSVPAAIFPDRSMLVSKGGYVVHFSEEIDNYVMECSGYGSIIPGANTSTPGGQRQFGHGVAIDNRNRYCRFVIATPGYGHNVIDLETLNICIQEY
jgi:hypothetical protein